MEIICVDIKDRGTLGKVIQTLRIQQGKSIRSFAEECGLSKSTIVNIESGAFSPRLEIITKIIEKLGAKLQVTND